MKDSKQGAYKLWKVLPEESSSSYKIAMNTNAITKMRWARIFESTKVSGVINENDCIRRLMIIYKTNDCILPQETMSDWQKTEVRWNEELRWSACRHTF